MEYCLKYVLSKSILASNELELQGYVQLKNTKN